MSERLAAVYVHLQTLNGQSQRNILTNQKDHKLELFLIQILSAWLQSKEKSFTRPLLRKGQQSCRWNHFSSVVHDGLLSLFIHIMPLVSFYTP